MLALVGAVMSRSPAGRCCSETVTGFSARTGVIGPLDAPEALLLGLPDDTGRLRVAGRTGPLTLPARRELGTLLVPPQRTHPWPERIPASRFGQLPGDLVDYTPAEPLLVVEGRRLRVLRAPPLAPPDGVSAGTGRVGSGGPVAAWS